MILSLRDHQKGDIGAYRPIPARMAFFDQDTFVGGGALFFTLYRSGQLHEGHIFGLNAELIDTYVAVRDHVEQDLLEKQMTGLHRSTA